MSIISFCLSNKKNIAIHSWYRLSSIFPELCTLLIVILLQVPSQAFKVVLYVEHLESANHMLIHCGKARGLWILLVSLFDLGPPFFYERFAKGMTWEFC